MKVVAWQRYFQRHCTWQLRERQRTTIFWLELPISLSLSPCTWSPSSVYIKYLSFCLLPSLSLITNLETTFKHYRLAINHDWLDRGLTHHIGQLSRMTLFDYQAMPGIHVCQECLCPNSHVLTIEHVLVHIIREHVCVIVILLS